MTLGRLCDNSFQYHHHPTQAQYWVSAIVICYVCHNHTHLPHSCGTHCDLFCFSRSIPMSLPPSLVCDWANSASDCFIKDLQHWRLWSYFPPCQVWQYHHDHPFGLPEKNPNDSSAWSNTLPVIHIIWRSDMHLQVQVAPRKSQVGKKKSKGAWMGKDKLIEHVQLNSDSTDVKSLGGP